MNGGRHYYKVSLRFGWTIGQSMDWVRGCPITATLDVSNDCQGLSSLPIKMPLSEIMLLSVPAPDTKPDPTSVIVHLVRKTTKLTVGSLVSLFYQCIDVTN